MNILNELNNYEKYVDENFNNVLCDFIVQKNPFLDESENEMYSVIKLLTVSSTISYSNDLKLFYFKNFLEKVKKLISSGNKIIFKNGLFDSISQDSETYLSKLDIDSDEKEFEEFKKNVSYSFFYLIRFLHNISSDFEKDLLNKTKYEIFNEYKDEPFVLEYPDLIDINIKERKKIFPIEMFWKIFDLIKNNDCYENQYKCVAELERKEIEEDSDEKKYFEKNKKIIIECVDYLKNTPFFTKKIEEILFNVIFSPKVNRYNIMKKILNNKLFILNLSKNEYVEIKKDLYHINEDINNVDKDIDFLNTLTEEDINKSGFKLKMFTNNDDNYIDLVYLTKVKSIKDREKILNAIDVLTKINDKDIVLKNNIPYSDIIFSSYMKEYLYVNEMIATLNIKEKIKYLNDRKNKGLLNKMEIFKYINTDAIKKHEINNALMRKEISYSDAVNDMVELYTKKFVIERELCGFINKNINSDYLKINKINEDQLQIMISWTKDLSIEECMMIIQDLYPDICNNEEIIDIVIHCKMRSYELNSELKKKEISIKKKI